MLRLLIVVLGRSLAALPAFIVKMLVATLGAALYYAPTNRRRTLLANLANAFPEKTEAWRRQTALKSCLSTIEMGLLLVASPYFSIKRIRKQFSATKKFQAFMKEASETPNPRIILVPHLCHMEAITLVPAIIKQKVPETGTIYRPLKNKTLERWVQETRSRFGIKLLSRKAGFSDAIDILRRNGMVAILFDQNAGYQGNLTLFMDRLTSASELHGLLAKKCEAAIYAVYTKRTGFMRAEIDVELLTTETQDSFRNTLIANQWLEKMLQDEAICPDWLWTHARWRTQNEWNRRLQIHIKRNTLSETLEFQNKTTMPRKTKFCFRMPNWLGDVIMALPILRSIREARPDAHITLVCKPQFIELLKLFDVADKLIAVPTEKPWSFFWSLRKEYFESYFLFTNSFRGDFEAFLTRTPQRFGMLRKGKWRPLLTRTWNVPTQLDETEEHQTHVWQQFFEHFGLNQKPNLSPFQLALDGQKSGLNLINKLSRESERSLQASNSENTSIIGLICGTENAPEKRWPIDCWKALITKLLAENNNFKIVLFGTARDNEITTAVAESFPEDRVINLAGKTNLIEYTRCLSACELIITNDTGGMHLASSIGIPLIGIFGPTNPVRTGPIFNSPKEILQPYNCPKTGGMPIQFVHPDRVYRTALDLLSTKQPIS